MKRGLLLMLAVMLALSAQGEITLPKIVGDNMVLQRNANVNIWGWAEPNARITIENTWSDHKYETKANAQGEWQLMMATPDRGDKQSISIQENRDTPTIVADIMIGEVWICSGQSNMSMPINGFPRQPIAQAVDILLDSNKFPDIRIFTVANSSKAEPVEDVESAGWQRPSIENVASTSAVAYLFARRLNGALDVPIGIVVTAWGGSRIEAWLSQEQIDSIVGIDHEATKNGVHENSKRGALYNGMIHPIERYTAKGFIWYQGESNLFNPEDYDDLMVAMVDFWREKWQNPGMPFYFVQIAPYKYEGYPSEALGLLVEAQVNALRAIPNSGMASTTDLGNSECIHPEKKVEVADRLAFMALRNDYGVKGLPHDAPIYKSMEIKGSEVTLSFDNLGYACNAFREFKDDGRITVTGFEIAGEDRHFHPAQVRFDGYWNIVVSSDMVAEPVAVRYAFSNVPNANAETCFEQPLVPFRTDRW